MSETVQERNKAIVRKIYEVGFNAGDALVFEALYAPNFRHHNKTIHDVSAGGAGEAESMRRFRDAIPDARFTIEDQIAEGDRVANRLSVRGTPVKTFPPIEPTGEEMEFRAVAIFRIVDGLVAEEWFYREPTDSKPGPESATRE
ncbi:MAG: ester cyclase [Myxococcota bacterium]